MDMDIQQAVTPKNNFPVPNNTPSPPSVQTAAREPTTQQSTYKSPLIRRCVKRLSENKLFGQPHVKSYLTDSHRRGCRPNTIRCNFQSIYLFIAHLKRCGHTCIETATKDDLSRFVESEQDRGMSPNTVSTRLRFLYAFFNYLVERDVVHPNILKKKLRIKVPDTLPRAIAPQDICRMLSVIKNPRDWAMILILLRTGMRIGELLRTRISDINLGENRIDIYEAEKTRIGRVVYLSDDARNALRVWLKRRNRQKEYLFYGQGSYKSISYETSRRMFDSYMEKAGLAHKGYTLHCLRHTCASELLNAGMRLECLQQLLGHSSIEMTRRYARLTDNTRREEYFRAMAIIENGGIDGNYQRRH
jgi:integrase/recombinase XerD